MAYQIDQSGKIENTSKDTILCLANGGWDAIVLKAAVKRQIQEIFRRHGMPRNYVLFTFSAILAVLIKRNLKLSHITVDREYYGKEPEKEEAKHKVGFSEILSAIKKTEVGKRLKNA